TDVLIDTSNKRNRALSGDLVVVLLDKKETWPVRRNKASCGSSSMADANEPAPSLFHEMAPSEPVAEPVSDSGSPSPSRASLSSSADGAMSPISTSFAPSTHGTRQWVGNAADAKSPGECRPTGHVVAILESTMPATLIGGIEISTDNRTVRFIPQDILLPKFIISVPSAELEKLQRLSPSELRAEIFEASSQPWSCGQFLPRCTFKAHLGKSTELSTALKIIQASNSLPSDEFPRPVQNQARDMSRWSLSPEDLVGRTDCRGLRVFSIDPATAKDLDDALSVVARPDQHVEIGVHIADVSYFVPPDSPMDAEALRRATTFYLPWKNIPMLPRVLADNLCSLLPGQDRLSFSVFWVFSPDHQIVQCYFAKTVIRSRCKLTYEQAQALLDQPPGAVLPELPSLGLDAEELSGITADLRVLDGIAKRLRSDRFRAGSLLLNSPKIVFDLEPVTHAPLSYHLYEYKETNHLVEEFMLLANTSVANRIFNVFPETALLRRHPAPKKERLLDLEKDAAAFGVAIDTSSSLSLHRSLEAVREAARLEKQSGIERGPMQTRSRIIHLLARKPMELAQYLRSASALPDDH
ncbi:MAG TPA: RNB domain-containing ribonuclease, partial [archaeon]|nr:RNB domain-containing ribonuclease [archaeon]